MSDGDDASSSEHERRAEVLTRLEAHLDAVLGPRPAVTEGSVPAPSASVLALDEAERTRREAATRFPG